MRSPVPHCSPPRKDFCRAKMPCGGQVFQICCSAVKSSDFLHASRYLHARKRVLPQYVEDARLGGHCKSGTPGISKGPQPFCFRKSPEKTLLKGFLWATSSRRLDTALLCAAKKRGVETYQAGKVLPVYHWSPDHGSGKKAPRCRQAAKTKTLFPFGKISGII